MKKIITGFFGLILAVCSAGTNAVAADPVDHVSILVGTESKYELSTGNTYPAVAMPWGMNFWTPQTGQMGNGWTYVYSADKIRGLKQTHQPSPWINDYGQFSIMPATGLQKYDEDARASWYSHKAEIAKPYYYNIYLADHDVTAELAPTERACFFRFSFPESDDSSVIVDAFDRGSYVRVIPGENKVVGYTTRNNGGVPENFKNWFVLVFDKPFASHSVSLDGQILEERDSAEGGHALAVVRFNTVRGEQVHVRVASSFISPEQAELNLKELPATFDETVTNGRTRWNEVLGRIEVEDDNVDNLRTFYSCLYRSLLFPRDLSEIDANGERVHYSPYNGEVRPGYMFTDTGFWDTFRSLFPLLNLLYPDMSAKMQEGLVNAYLESGFLPEWASPGHRDCMIGNNSASVVADAWLKGIRGYDIEKLWEALKHDANSVHPTVSSTGRAGYGQYNELGYVPSDRELRIGRGTARTLEYAYDDWCIYTLGKALGKPESEIAVYGKRALNYRNVYDPEYKLMAGRAANGQFDSLFNPAAWSGVFCEGNSWHWSFCVFHDPAGLVDLMGGPAEFNTMMDSVFILPGKEGLSSRRVIHEMREMQVMDMGQYAHGNQPIQHMVYMYNWGGEPWKAQYRVREIMDKLYTAAPDGYCGDEDNGQTSAWYVFSAMGFYPVCPGSDEYALGSPMFKKMKLNFPDGRQTVISAPENGPGKCYIASMKVGGRNYTKNYLTHEALSGGTTIKYTMSAEPNKNRGVSQQDVPYSFSRTK